MFRVALVGAGGMGGMHASCYKQIANAELVGVMDIRAEAAQAMAEKHKAQAFTNFDAMLEQTRPDVVDVCCPTPWHVEYVCQAAHRAGELGIRGISTEKPMARTVAECQKMIVCLRIGQTFRCSWPTSSVSFPEFALAKRGVDDGLCREACRHTPPARRRDAARLE